MPKSKQPNDLTTHFVAGGAAGAMEALICHPLDTIKVRMQLKTRQIAHSIGSNAPKPPVGSNNFISVGARIVHREGVLALYKGLGAVLTGITPKMAIRFTSFELYKSWLRDKQTGKVSTTATFFAGIGAGVTEAVAVVTPMEVVKIRLQAQRNSTRDPTDIPKYRNAPHAAYTVIREEGFGALYKGVSLTALRQATNQGVNFTAYQELKKQAMKLQNLDELPSYQHLILGGVSGAMGPLCNNPIDTIKTRIQRTPNPAGQSGWSRIKLVATDMIRHEGWTALYRGITPRVLRVAPGQAITFMVYEKVKHWIYIVKEQREKQLTSSGDY
ncbi:Mitochondrial succinate-fumarate transporter [Spiromyces aspiralis]|uniref:Mitochondrial succinate-fumarate transporter n=1 Tax=Spiromyces aspiralis TaxID=68401 RepID=A0ACC1I1R9_9FUNG|nr:Mitochondrial succinate-fumarate transporter [Spiromyces aspiralis]